MTISPALRIFGAKKRWIGILGLSAQLTGLRSGRPGPEIRDDVLAHPCDIQYWGF